MKQARSGSKGAARPPGAALALLGAVLGGLGAQADDDARALTGMLDSMAAYRADFEQVVSGRFGEVVQTATGTLHLERPRKLRWEVDEPYPQLILADGDHVWIYDPDLEQATVQPFDETVEGTPATFLTDPSVLAGNFLVRAEGSANDSERRFRLAPRDPDSSSLFRAVTLAFSSRGLLTRLEIVDHLEQRTRITFRNGELNPVLESALFQFDVPEGVDVIGNLPDDVAAESAP